MAFSYNPKDAADCLAQGNYDAIMTSVEEKQSKAGKPMLQLVFTVPYDGRDFRVREYIVNPTGLFKLKQLAKAFGQVVEFEEGRFDAMDCINKTLVLELEVECSAQFGDQNRIKAYAPASGNPVTVSPDSPAPTSDIPVGGDIPFAWLIPALIAFASAMS